MKINLYEPGAIDRLLAFHRARFGDARMEAEGDTPPADTPPAQDPKPDSDKDAGKDPQAEVEKWKALARKHEGVAKTNADAAKRLAEIEDAQKSEAEKAADKIAKAEAEVSTIPAKVADALKGHLVALHEISDEDAELFLTASEPDLLLKQIARLQERNADAGKPRAPRPDPNQGRTPNGVPLDPRSADLAQIEADIAAGSRRR